MQRGIVAVRQLDDHRSKLRWITRLRAVKLYTTLPNARLILLPDAGHASFFQYPELFVQETGAFLKN